MGKPLTDEERSKIISRLKDNPPQEEKDILLQKLEQDIDDFVNTRKKTPYKDGWNEDTFISDMENHPAFMTKMPQPGEPLPPLIEALQQLKYSPDENTPQELATNYKEDGNYNFQASRYQLAVLAYTEGLKFKHEDTLLKVQLFTNRAMTQFHLQNYRSSFEDCKEAIKLKSDHLKAMLWAIRCCLKLERYSEAVEWCDRALSFQPTNKEIKANRVLAVQKQKKKALEERKRSMKNDEDLNELNKVLDAIRNRGIRIEPSHPSLDDLVPQHPAGVDSRVYLNSKRALVWPVIFLYPEYGESDFIQNFDEYSRFEDHLEAMFGNDKPNWDSDHKYTPSSLNIYYEDSDNSGVLHKVHRHQQLAQVLAHKKLVVKHGTPMFAVLVDGSSCEKAFLARYDT